MLSRLFSSQIAIDLGTANCLVFVRDHGIVLNEPSVVALKVNSKEVLAVGVEAKRMLGIAPPNIMAVRPMKSGVIASIDITEAMLTSFIRRAMTLVPWYRRLLRPQVLIAVPSGITDVENRAVKDNARHAGAGEVVLVEEPMAAAVGVGLPVAEPEGSMIVDIGGGTTEVAIISLSGIACARSARVGGDNFDAAIIAYLKKQYSIAISENWAEQIKIKLGSAYPFPEEEDTRMDVSGGDMITCLPKTISINAREIREAIAEPVAKIVETVRLTLENCQSQPGLVADLLKSGIMLSGGGALLRGLKDLLRDETGLPVFVADEPLNAVVRGAGVMLQEPSIWSA